MRRSKIREQVFKLLFEAEFNSAEEMSKQAEYFYQNEENATEEEYQLEVKNKLNAILDKRSELDETISNVTIGWSLDRIGKIELTILRLAIYEIKYDEGVPTLAAIDEAVELAKKFGSENSGSFINGVLAKLA